MLLPLHHHANGPALGLGRHAVKHPEIRQAINDIGHQNSHDNPSPFGEGAKDDLYQAAIDNPSPKLDWVEGPINSTWTLWPFDIRVSVAPPHDKPKSHRHEERWLAHTSTHRHIAGTFKNPDANSLLYLPVTFPSRESAMAFQELLLLRFMQPVIRAQDADPWLNEPLTPEEEASIDDDEANGWPGAEEL